MKRTKGLPVKIIDSKHQCFGGNLRIWYFKTERLIENWIQCFTMNFGFKFFLLVRQ